MDFVEVEEFERVAALQIQAAKVEWAKAAACAVVGERERRIIHLWMAALCYAAASRTIMEGLGEDPRRTEMRADLTLGRKGGGR